MAVDLSGLMPQQRQIATTLDGPLFVAAGAGSGKTFTLTQRIVWALDPASGPALTSLDQVLAITFTTDAAAEIRERVRGALRAAGMDEAARSVDNAWISTIHGMCSRILRAHALELGIDPDFSVVTDPQELMDRAFARVIAQVGVVEQDKLSEAFNNAEGSAAAQFAHGGRYAHLFSWYPVRGEISPTGNETGASIYKIVLGLFELARVLPGGLDAISFAHGGVSMTDFANACQAYIHDFEGTKGAQKALSLLEAINQFEMSEHALDDVITFMMTLDMPDARGAAKEAAKLLKAEAANAVIDAFVATGKPMAAELMDLTRAFAATFENLKREAGVLDNDDLLHYTREALANHPDIRAQYADRFKLVMIDEFQDTDQQQVDIIRYLTGPGDRALCTVGDAQQSIYRFRGADVEVFRKQEHEIEQQEEDHIGTATVVHLVRNFRSHPDILRYVAQVFDDACGGIMPHFLDLEPHPDRRDGLRAKGAPRCQAVFTVGGTQIDRIVSNAQTIAQRFKALADAGQPEGGMAVLLGRMTNADVYANALREEGLNCVVAGGSIFSDTEAAQTVLALVQTLANPADTAQGLLPLLTSSLFALGVEELLALATDFDGATGEIRRRNLDIALTSDTNDAPGLEHLPLVERARTILNRALARVGRDSVAAIAHDVVNESGVLLRLAERGAEGRAEAANFYKALDVLGELELQTGKSPRATACAFRQFLDGKEAPGALNEHAANAVRIMTVHASKGLEFPVVAVAECYDIKKDSSRFQAQRIDGAVHAVALPTLSYNKAASKRLRDLYTTWLDPTLVDDVCATGSAAETYLSLRAYDNDRSLEERGRLLYVAMTRAREVLIVALESDLTSEKKVPTLKFKPDKDLTGSVLERIIDLQDGFATDRLALDGALPGSFKFIALSNFVFDGTAYEATAEANSTEEAIPSVASEQASEQIPEEMDSWLLVWPQEAHWFALPAARSTRISYSYSSLAQALHAAKEDQCDRSRIKSLQASTSVLSDKGDEDLVYLLDTASTQGDLGEGQLLASEHAEAPEDPTALGSAFHAAAQWLIETDAETVPEERRVALVHQWGLTDSQRTRFDMALERWERSQVRAELKEWSCVRAEVPFFAPGDPNVYKVAGFADGANFVEGSIDVLATNPQDNSHVLVLDYKTGGSSTESIEELMHKHELQADVYARVLKDAGYKTITLKFVRVEIDDVEHPGEPQVVCFER